MLRTIAVHELVSNITCFDNLTGEGIESARRLWDRAVNFVVSTLTIRASSRHSSDRCRYREKDPYPTKDANSVRFKSKL